MEQVAQYQSSKRELVTQVNLKRLDPELPVPVRAHRGDAGVDLYSTQTLELQPGERALVGTDQNK